MPNNQLSATLILVVIAVICATIDAFGIKRSHVALPNWQAAVKLCTSNKNYQRRKTHIYQSSNDDEFMNDQRDGMADAFAALNSLTSLDAQDDAMEDDDDLKKELFADMMGELPDVPDDISIDDMMADFQRPKAVTPNVEDLDGIGLPDDNEPVLTTEDVTNDILNQDVEQALDVENFMSSAFKEAMGDLEKEDVGGSGIAASVAKSVMEDEDFKKEIGAIFDKAAEEMKNEIEIMRQEQAAITEEARKRGVSFEDSQKERLSEAEESVSRLIKKVAEETDSVQRAMEDLERVKRDASNSSIEESALDLKKGGIVKQAALVGMALFGSRAFTETILVVGSSNGGDHTMSAVLQGIIALACAGYFFLVK